MTLADHRSGGAREPQVELLVPVLPVLVRGADQGDEAGAEDQRGTLRPPPSCAGQRAAHRYGGSAAPGLERHPYADAAGHRPRPAQRPPPARKPAVAAGAARPPGRRARPRPARPPGPGRPRRNDDDGQAGAQAGQVHRRRDRDRPAGPPIGISGDAAKRWPRRQSGPPRSPGRPGQGQRRAARVSQGRQNGKLRRVQRELAGDEQGLSTTSTKCGQRGEHRKPDRLRPDRPLRRTPLPGQVREIERPGGRVMSGQRAGRGGELDEAHARPQPHVCRITRAKLATRTSVRQNRDSSAPAARRPGEARAPPGHRSSDHRRYPERQRDRAALGSGLARCGRAHLRRAWHTEQVQRAARPQPSHSLPAAGRS